MVSSILTFSRWAKLKAALQYFVDLHAQIFRGGHAAAEFRQRVQVHVLVARQDFALHEAVEVARDCTPCRCLPPPRR